jgi:galactokinase
MLKTHPVPLETQEFAVVSHLAWENQWIVRSETALRDGDHQPLGQFLNLSHESARDGLRLVSPEAEALVTIACGSPGCLGARALFEAGRIATISLVNYHEIEAFIANLSAKGSNQLERPIQPLVCPIVEGAG